MNNTYNQIYYSILLVYNLRIYHHMYNSNEKQRQMIQYGSLKYELITSNQT